MHTDELALGPAETQTVRETLHSILESPHFCRSKRYPAFLEYVVINTLEGNHGTLKERFLGAEIFNRPCTYDPGTDPIVRVAAGEVRKRLAQYFADHPDAPVRIDLPVGGYAAEFHFRPIPVQEFPRTESAALSRVDPAPAFAFQFQWNRKAKIALVAALLVAAIASSVAWKNQADRSRREFWSPVFRTGEPTLLIVGKKDQPASGSVQTVSTTSNSASRPYLALDDVAVVARTCNIFRAYGHDCSMVSAASVASDEIQGKPAVLIGAFNNEWTSKLSAALPYQVGFDDPSLPSIKRARVIYEQRPSGNVPLWTVPAGDQIAHDYAIVARFRSSVSNAMTIVIAGLGPAGTGGAGQFLFAPDKMKHLLAQAPKDWDGVNFEAVIETDVAQGEPASSKVVAVKFW